MPTSDPMHQIEPVHESCGAKTRGGATCRNAPVTGSTRCRMHGGASPRGIASAGFKTGRHSRHLPVRLLARYHEAAQDGNLLSLRDDVALVDARLADVLSRVDTGESGARWAQVQADFARFRESTQRGDVGQARIALGALEHAITASVADYDSWSDVRTLLDQRARLVEAERKRLAELQQTISAEKAMTLVAAVQASVLKHVTDRSALAGIANDIARLLTFEARGRPN